MHIITGSLSDYEKVILYIKSENFNHFSYTPTQRKPINLILNGINSDYSSEEVIDEINSLNLDNVNIIKCVILKNKNSVASSSNIFLLSLSHGYDTKELVKIKYLFLQRVYFDKLKKHDGISQCHRCQRFGHSSANCAMEPRCVKCKENHLTINCNNIKTVNERTVDKTGNIINNKIF